MLTKRTNCSEIVTQYTTWTLDNLRRLLNKPRSNYLHKRRSYLRSPSCYTPCSLKRDSHSNKAVRRIVYYTIWSIVEILNQSRSIAKRLVECMLLCLWTIGNKCDQEKLWGEKLRLWSVVSTQRYSPTLCKQGLELYVSEDMLKV